MARKTKAEKEAEFQAEQEAKRLANKIEHEKWLEANASTIANLQADLVSIYMSLLAVVTNKDVYKPRHTKGCWGFQIRIGGGLGDVFSITVRDQTLSSNTVDTTVEIRKDYATNELVVQSGANWSTGGTKDLLMSQDFVMGLHAMTVLGHLLHQKMSEKLQTISEFQKQYGAVASCGNSIFDMASARARRQIEEMAYMYVKSVQS